MTNGDWRTYEDSGMELMHHLHFMIEDDAKPRPKRGRGSKRSDLYYAHVAAAYHVLVNELGSDSPVKDLTTAYNALVDQLAS